MEIFFNFQGRREMDTCVLNVSGTKQTFSKFFQEQKNTKHTSKKQTGTKRGVTKFSGTKGNEKKGKNSQMREKTK